MVGRQLSIVLIVVATCGGCARSDSQQQARSSLSQIGKALLNYQGMMGAFPSAMIRDADGKPQQGWRGLLLHQFEKNTPWFNGRIAWDAPENLSVGAQSLGYYCDRKAKTNKSRYLAVVGDECLMREGRPARIRRLTAPLSEIGMIVDVGEQGIPWSQPGDLSLDEFLARFGKRAIGPHAEGVLTLFGDCSVRMVPYETPIEKVRAVFTVHEKPQPSKSK